MPIVVVGVPVITPPGGGTGGPDSSIPLPPAPLETFNLTLAGNGDEVSLTSSGHGQPFLAVRGAQGFDMPPVSVFSDPLPANDGDYFRGVRHNLRVLRIPVLVYGPTQPIARVNQRRLLKLLSPKAGPVKVTVGQWDGTSRYTFGRYSGGVEGDWGTNWSPDWDIYGISISCFDPYFYDTRSAEYLWRLGETVYPFLSETVPFFPVRLAQLTVDFADIALLNDGDVESYPTWQITGPVASVTIGNNDTGEQFSLGAVSGGQTVTVVTERPFQSIRDQAGTNLWTLMDTGGQLFPIQPGVQHISIDAESIGPAAAVRMSHQLRYLAA